MIDISKNYSVFKQVLDDISERESLKILGDNVKSFRDMWKVNTMLGNNVVHSDFLYFYNDKNEEIAYLSKSLYTENADTLYVLKKPRETRNEH